jgi:hypothetical protein
MATGGIAGAAGPDNIPDFERVRVALPVALPASERPLAVRRLLALNTVNSTREVIGLDEAEGISQLQKLAAESRLEEMWAYLPELGVWIEIGFGEGEAEFGPQVEGDTDYLGRLIGSFSRVHLYHFHPRSAFRPAGLEAQIYPASSTVDRLTPEARTTVGLALPSPSDIATSARVAVLHHKLNPDAEILNFVVSPYGIVEYAPTIDGRRGLAAEEGHPRASLERTLTLVAAVRRSSFNIQRTVMADPALTVSGLIAALCEQLSDDDYAMRFMELPADL